MQRVLDEMMKQFLMRAPPHFADIGREELKEWHALIADRQHTRQKHGLYMLPPRVLDEVSLEDLRLDVFDAWIATNSWRLQASPPPHIYPVD